MEGGGGVKNLGKVPTSFMDGLYEESNDHYIRLRLYWKLYGHNGSS